MNKNCCINCDKRATGENDCHKKCKDYQKWLKKHNKRKEMIRNAKYLEGLHL